MESKKTIPLSDSQPSCGNNVSIGENCTIAESATLGNDISIGNNVSIGPGCSLCDGMRVEDNCRIAPGVVFTRENGGDDVAPDQRITVSQGVSIGANSTICQVSVGSNAVIRPGTVVTRKIPPNTIVCGNPAKITGYVDTDIVTQQKHMVNTEDASYTSKTGALIYNIPKFSDMRGDLSVIEIEQLLPFPIKRMFYTYNIDTELVRGEHAHIQCHQFLISVAGSVNVLCDNGKQREEFVLDGPHMGLHIPPLCWGVQYKHSKDNILLVLASHAYDADDYIRDYDNFLKHITSGS